MARIPYPDSLSQETSDRLVKLGNLNVTRMMAHSEALMDGYSRLGLAILRKGKLDPKLREIAVLKIGLLCESDYEWHQHVSFARAVGVPEDTIEALATGDTSRLPDVERLVVAFAEETFSEKRVSNEVFSAISEHLCKAQLIELSLACGYYIMTAGYLRTFDIEIEDGPSLGETVSGSST